MSTLLPLVYKVKNKKLLPGPRPARAAGGCGAGRPRGRRWVWSRPAPQGAVCTSNLSPRIASPLQYDLTSRTWTFLGSTCTRRLSVCPRTLATLTHSGERVRVCACAVVALPRHSSRHGLDGRCMGPAVECYVSKEKTPVNSIECRGQAGVEGVSEVVVETPLLVTQW